jgi:hypothetical protein
VAAHVSGIRIRYIPAKPCLSVFGSVKILASQRETTSDGGRGVPSQIAALIGTSREIFSQLLQSSQQSTFRCSYLIFLPLGIDENDSSRSRSNLLITHLGMTCSIVRLTPSFSSLWHKKHEGFSLLLKAGLGNIMKSMAHVSAGLICVPRVAGINCVSFDCVGGCRQRRVSTCASLREHASTGLHCSHGRGHVG